MTQALPHLTSCCARTARREAWLQGAGKGGLQPTVLAFCSGANTFPLAFRAGTASQSPSVHSAPLESLLLDLETFVGYGGSSSLVLRSLLHVWTLLPCTTGRSHAHPVKSAGLRGSPKGVGGLHSQSVWRNSMDAGMGAIHPPAFHFQIGGTCYFHKGPFSWGPLSSHIGSSPQLLSSSSSSS